MRFRVVPDEPYFMSVNSSGHSFGQTGRHRVHAGRDGIRRRSVVQIFGVQNFEFPLNLSQTLSNIFRALFGSATQYAKCQPREPLLKGKDLYD